MKKQMILAVLCGTILLGGVAAQAQPTSAQGDAPDGRFRGQWICPRGDFSPEQLPPIFDCLDLSETQQKEVQALMDDSMARSIKLHAKMREVERQLRQVMEPSKFEEKAFRKLASEKAAIEADLMVERGRTHSRIYALLTPEQKELADLASKLRRLKGRGSDRPERPMPRPMCMESTNVAPAN